MHRESPFTILPGIVDTDTYTAPVNFPFVLNDINFEGLIPAGTPIAQVIPIKRDEWQMSLGTQKEFDEQQKVTNRLQTKFFDRYKSMFRQVKEYK
jgi:predicted membrane-bound spermidine synthase